VSYADVAEADDALGHVNDWTSLDTPAKQRALDAALLWLGTQYIIGTPAGDVLEKVKRAEIVAARVSLSVPLFSEPTTGGTQGALIYTRKKVGSLEKEERWGEPGGNLQFGPVSIPEVDAILLGVLPPVTLSSSSSTSSRLVTAL